MSGMDGMHRYLAAVEAFNAGKGDPSALCALMADDCDWPGVGSSRETIRQAMDAAIASTGWCRHDVVSITAHGNLVAATARNSFADGSTSDVAGLLRFGPDGNLVAVRNLEGG